MTSTDWTVYNEGAKRTTYSVEPTSNITAETVMADGFTLSQKDTVGITSTSTRRFTAEGTVLVETDGRGNATTTVTNKAGRTISVTDAAGHVTATTYDAAWDKPSAIIDAQGNTTCYRYDERGRKVAEWGTGIQPALFGYDEADKLVSLKTFRAGTEIISTDPVERTDADETTWTFDPATGLELSKTYADVSSIVKTYDAYNRLSVETLARGITRIHSYEHARSLLLGTTYSDGTTARSYTYNHLGQLTQIVDAAGTRTIGYNSYGEQETDSLLAGGVTHLITESVDDLGRNAGYTYAENGTVQQTVTTGYNSDGRISSAGFLHQGAEKQFGYSYLPGSNLLQTLTMPNGVTLEQSYEAQRDLLTGMVYKHGGTNLTSREYVYDALGRPTARDTKRQDTEKNDTFSYNNRSELVNAVISGTTHAYDYDNIGNRRMAIEGEEYSLYESNALNQYTVVQEGSGSTEPSTFTPIFDADGNQTLVKTNTGIWTVTYDAENRPVTFTRIEEDGTETQVTCTYDYIGRRATKKVTVNNSVTLHQRYLYRGYLQIAACDLTSEGTPNLWHILWDPTQPIATRPLVIQKDGIWYCYGWDLTKNICEVFGSNGHINTIYTYTPYGEVTSSGSTVQPIQWSSEYADAELGLVYYNFRYYASTSGRWVRRDLISEKRSYNRYGYTYNRSIYLWDYLGKDAFYIPPGIQNAAMQEYNKVLSGEYYTNNDTLSEDALNWIKENCHLFAKLAQCFDLDEVEINAVAMAIAEEYSQRRSTVHLLSDKVQDYISKCFPNHVAYLGNLWRPDLGAGNININTAKRVHNQLISGQILPEKKEQISSIINENGFQAKPGDLVTPNGAVFYAAAEMARLKEAVNQNGYFNNISEDYNKAQNYVDLWREGDKRLEKMGKNQQEKKKQGMPYIPKHKYGDSYITAENYEKIRGILNSCTKK